MAQLLQKQSTKGEYNMKVYSMSIGFDVSGAVNVAVVASELEKQMIEGMDHLSVIRTQLGNNIAVDVYNINVLVSSDEEMMHFCMTCITVLFQVIHGGHQPVLFEVE